MQKALLPLRQGPSARPSIPPKYAKIPHSQGFYAAHAKAPVRAKRWQKVKAPLFTPNAR